MKIKVFLDVSNDKRLFKGIESHHVHCKVYIAALFSELQHLLHHGLDVQLCELLFLFVVVLFLIVVTTLLLDVVVIT